LIRSRTAEHEVTDARQPPSQSVEPAAAENVFRNWAREASCIQLASSDLVQLQNESAADEGIDSDVGPAASAECRTQTDQNEDSIAVSLKVVFLSTRVSLIY